MTSSSPPRRFSSRRPSRIASQSSRIDVAVVSSARDSSSATGTTSGGDSGTAARASASTPARSAAERVKLTITRSHAADTQPRLDVGDRPERGEHLACRPPTVAPTAASRAPLAPPPGPRNAAGPPWTPGGSRTSRPATAGVGARPRPAATRRPRPATAAGRPDPSGRTPVRRSRRSRPSGSRPAGAPTGRACADAARPRASVPAPARRRAAPRRRGPAPGGAPGSEGRRLSETESVRAIRREAASSPRST